MLVKTNEGEKTACHKTVCLVYDSLHKLACLKLALHDSCSLACVDVLNCSLKRLFKRVCADDLIICRVSTVSCEDFSNLLCVTDEKTFDNAVFLCFDNSFQCMVVVSFNNCNNSFYGHCRSSCSKLFKAFNCHVINSP